MDEQKEKRHPAFITDRAHKALPRLVKLIASERDNGETVSFTNAASLAIINELKRQERKAARREAMQS